jgi:hypothetical protein
MIIYLCSAIAARIMQPTRPAITSGQLFKPDLFGLAPRRDCRVSHRPALSASKYLFAVEKAGLLVSVALILSRIFLMGVTTGVTRYAALRSPDFPPATNTSAGDHSTCAYSVFKELSNLESIALFASLSAMELFSLFIEIISILSKPLAICWNMS